MAHMMSLVLKVSNISHIYSKQMFKRACYINFKSSKIIYIFEDIEIKNTVN